MIIQLTKDNEDAQMPERKHPDDSGADVRWCAAVDFEDRKSYLLKPRETKMFSTGLRVAHIPEGFEIQVRPRSGYALKKSITVLNSPGTVDAGYRGPLNIILHNAGRDGVYIEDGERIAQIVVAPVIYATFQETEEIQASERGEGGFGHSGMK